MTGSKDCSLVLGANLKVKSNWPEIWTVDSFLHPYFLHHFSLSEQIPKQIDEEKDEENESGKLYTVVVFTMSPHPKATF